MSVGLLGLELRGSARAEEHADLGAIDREIFI